MAKMENGSCTTADVTSPWLVEPHLEQFFDWSRPRNEDIVMDVITIWRKARGQDTREETELSLSTSETIKRDLDELDAIDHGVEYLQKVRRGGLYRLLLFRLDYAFCSRSWRNVFEGPGSKLLVTNILDALGERRGRVLASLGHQLQVGPSVVDRDSSNTIVPLEEYEPLILARPSIVSRYLAPCTLLLLLLGSTARLACRIDWTEAYSFVLDLSEASRHLLNDWIINPLLEIWKTIRYRSNNLGLVSAMALRADMDSLERMVTSFARKHYPQIPETEIVSQVRSGDVTLMLRRYETELQAPIRNLILGDIGSMLLIQIQKSKVDLEGAMMAIDRLLKANELNFELLAVIPLIALLFYGFSAGHGLLLRALKKSEMHTIDRFRSGMRQVEYLLNNQGIEETPTSLGELFIVIRRLLALWKTMPSRWRCKYSEYFYQDLTELLSMRTTNDKLSTVNRMYHYYPFLQGSI